MKYTSRFWIPLGLVLVISLTGCQTADHTEEGALFGGLFGAGAGAIVGHAMGNTAAGAAIGAGAGVLTGAAIGASKDDAEAKQRAAIAAQHAGVTVPDVVAMTRSGVEEELIINQIRSRGLAAPMQTNDVIYLQQQGVSRNVIEVMQTQPVATLVQPVPVYGAPSGGVIIEEGPRYYHPYHRYYW